jgi:23S rRNA (adenine-N6)-dimethyltransferase
MLDKRILLAQNFLKDPALVAGMVAASSIEGTDTVYEIGAGRGIITSELAKKAGKVVAIEKDPELVERLRTRFKLVGNVQVVDADFLTYDIREPEYKIFSNIPFNIIAKILRKILYAKHPPREAYLVMQKEAAEKFSGKPKETEFSVLIKPWFDLEIIREFRRTDFEPMPSVEIVLLNIKRRGRPLISSEKVTTYRKFVQYGFRAWKKDLKVVFKKVFTYEQWKRLSNDLGFSLRAIPTELKFEQWLGLFEFYWTQVPDFKKMTIYEDRRRTS